MSLEYFHTTWTAFVLWICLSFTVGWPLFENVTAVHLPMKFLKSSAVTSISGVTDLKDGKNEIVRATGDKRSSPSSVRINLYRLPPSPANLLKPDGFQFYTYNEKGDMITKQMTIQEIQALIAGGGPDHSNVEIQEPQKAEDILTGGKKVMDVVEKVQSVLKSAMDTKPPSILTASHPMIPEKANAEWSNILPSILAGDKYGNKVEETHYVKETTWNPSYTWTVKNDSSSDSLESKRNETVPSEDLENVTKYGERNEETVIETERNETEESPSTVDTSSGTATISYAEKLMIPVSVITTKQNMDEITQYTTESSIFHKITQVVPSLENAAYQHHYTHDKEEDSGFTKAVTKATTTDGFLPSSSDNDNDNADRTKEALDSRNNSLVTSGVTHRIDSSTTQTLVDDTKVVSKTQTSSVLESNQVETSVTAESFTSFAVTSLPVKSWTIAHDTVTKSNDLESTQPLKPLSIELINSLSSVISQVSEEVSSVLPINSGFESTPSKDEKEKRNNGSEIASSAIHTAIVASTMEEEIWENPNNRSEQGTVDNKWIVDQEKIDLTTDPDKRTNYYEISTKPDSGDNVPSLQSPLNASKQTTTTNFNHSQSITMIENILDTASTEANTVFTESLTFPNNPWENNLSANTLASALIAGFESFNFERTNKTQNVSYETTSSSQELDKTDVTQDSKLSVSMTDNTENTKSTKKKEDPVTEFSEKKTSTLETTSESSEENTSSATNKNGSTETTVSSNEDWTNLKTESLEGISQGTLDSEISSMERNEWLAYHTTVPSDESWTKSSESSTVIRDSSNAGTTQGSWKETEKHENNDTKPFVVVVEEWTATTNVPKTSSTQGITDVWNGTIASNGSANESKKDKETASATIATNWTNRDESENDTKKCKDSDESEVGTISSQNKSETNDRYGVPYTSWAPQKKGNGTDTNPEHTWQRISLHRTTPSSATKLTTTSTAAASILETKTKTKTQVESSSGIETESTVSLNASKSIGGLDTSTRNASIDIVNFSRLCNELAMKFWTAANKGLSSGRSLVLSPFGTISLLAMIFLGARGSTSDQMNEVLGLDNVATFNPHLIFQNVTDTVSLARHQGVANAAFVRELFADKAKVRKLLPFYKEQAQQFYEGLVAEVNFATISDLARRRTNLLIRKQTGGRIKDFAKSNAVPLRSPLAAISANVFQTDCNTSGASATGRDGELYFAISSAHRSRKLIPVPATVWRSNVLAGYEPSLDATGIALGGIEKVISTIFILPGQQGHAAPGDTLDRLEQRLAKEGAFEDGSWEKLLKVLIPRTNLEVQIPKFSHRSVVNATAALKRMGLDRLFSSDADFKGINGIGNRLFLSDVLQMNLFSTCGDENIGNGRHHVETYPASPSWRNSGHDEESRWKDGTISGKERRRRNAKRGEDKPRLKLDQPFLYLVRHNPTGLILHMGRFNPRSIQN